jgi:hypothetical protein
VLFFDDSISYFVSHLRSVRKYLYVFAIVFVNRSGCFCYITFAAGSSSKHAEPDVKLSSINWFPGRSVVSWYHYYSPILFFICVSPRYSAVLINRGYRFLGRIAYSSCWVHEIWSGSAFVNIQIADFALFNFLISSNFARPASHRRFFVLHITKVPSASLTHLW